MTRQQIRRAVLGGLVTLLSTLLLLEAGLRFIDPLGVYRYFADYTALVSLSLPARDGFRYTPGTHVFSRYRATVGLDGLRVVVSTHDTSCHIAFIGDSVTFGMGSDISFVDLLAPAMSATLINAGLPGYSAPNVLKELATVPADGYVWLIIQNDDEPFFMWPQGAGGLPSATSLYLGRVFFDIARPLNTTRFQHYAEQILSREDVLGFAFEGAGLTDVIESAFPQVHILPMYTRMVSWSDAHPSPEGHQQIADSMRAAVNTFVTRRCAKFTHESGIGE